MNKKNKKQQQFYPIHLFYCIFSIILIITWFFPYYEVIVTESKKFKNRCLFFRLYKFSYYN